MKNFIEANKFNLSDFETILFTATQFCNAEFAWISYATNNNNSFIHTKVLCGYGFNNESAVDVDILLKSIFSRQDIDSPSSNGNSNTLFRIFIFIY